jgi:hypothetical protein
VAWASMKCFRAKDGSDEPPSGGCNGESDVHSETPATTRTLRPPIRRPSPMARAKAGTRFCIGNAPTENRHGLVVEAELGSATETHGTRSGTDDDRALFAGIATPHARRQSNRIP